MSILSVHDGPALWVKPLFDVGIKIAEDPEVSYNLVGTLYLSSSGWLLLTVPNAIVRGVFAAMKESGIELPPSGPDGTLNAHITVCTKDEVNMIGQDKITERGKQFEYTIGRLYSVKPDGWEGIDKVWFLSVHSPALQAFRKSYGLSPLPNEGKHSYHITVACRRRGVLGRNEKSKLNRE